MPRVLIVDDEEVIRKNIERMLSLEGYEVATAPNGRHALVIARSMLPDIVITDINMPHMDGFALLEAIRSHCELERTIVIMLTAAEDRSYMRNGMRLGADDYLTKPFKREDLLDSIAAQLSKLKRFERHHEHVIAQTVASTEQRTRDLFISRYAAQGSQGENTQAGSGTTTPHMGLVNAQQITLPGSPPGLPAGTTLKATVMFADIRGFTTMAERLSAQELAILLGRYFELACQPVLAYGGTHIKMLGDGLLALFEGESEGTSSTHARRAVSAAVALRKAAIKFAPWVRQEYGQRGLAEFSVGIGLHSGEVTLGRLGSTESSEITPLGDCVNIASRLQAASLELGWTIVASVETASLAGEGLYTGQERTVQIRGRTNSVRACEIRDISSSIDLPLTTHSTTIVNHTQALRAAVRENSEITARAAKDALKQSLWNLQSGSFGAVPQRFKGYEVIRKLGEGGMSDVFLAYSGAQKSEVVLKVLRTTQTNDSDMLRRFIQEYAVLASLSHHHIAKIYDQGFTDDYAYIAMEYLAGGDLKSEIAKRPGAKRVIDLLRQIVSALATIHSLGLVYRDLKPDNLMFRAGGELVLVDFGIVKSIRANDDALVKTLHGQVVGTPYYISPEQAASKEVTHRSDFYSLGVMMYELLTAQKPYRADSLNELLARHIHGDTPQLPREHAKFQPLLACLMAKDPNDRPADCQAIWLNLEMLGAD